MEDCIYNYTFSMKRCHENTYPTFTFQKSLWENIPPDPPAREGASRYLPSVDPSTFTTDLRSCVHVWSMKTDIPRTLVRLFNSVMLWRERGFLKLFSPILSSTNLFRTLSPSPAFLPRDLFICSCVCGLLTCKNGDGAGRGEPRGASRIRQKTITEEDRGQPQKPTVAVQSTCKYKLIRPDLLAIYRRISDQKTLKHIVHSSAGELAAVSIR